MQSLSHLLVGSQPYSDVLSFAASLSSLSLSHVA